MENHEISKILSEEKLTINGILKKYDLESVPDLLNVSSKLNAEELRLASKSLSEYLTVYDGEKQIDDEFIVNWDEGFYSDEDTDENETSEDSDLEDALVVGDHRLDNTLGRLAIINFLVERASDVDWDTTPSVEDLASYVSYQARISSLQEAYRDNPSYEILPFYDDDLALMNLTRHSILRDMVDDEFSRDSYNNPEAVEVEYYDLIYIIGLINLKKVKPEVKKKLMAAKRSEKRKEERREKEADQARNGNGYRW